MQEFREVLLKENILNKLTHQMNVNEKLMSGYINIFTENGER